MTVKIREPECVDLKRRGARPVEQLIAGMSLQEQLELRRKRTESMLEQQRKSNPKPSIT